MIKLQRDLLGIKNRFLMNHLMIIPAAGLGSRLKSSSPKVLFPVNGRAMIDYLFDLYASIMDCFILIVHPSFECEVRSHCATYSLQIEFELQRSSTGMLDAILIPKERVRKYQPKWVWITWCDQIAIHPETIRTLTELLNQNSKTALIFPTVLRSQPYIHLARNDRNEIIRVLHQREGDDLPDIGESDMGLFSLSFDTYLELLTDFSCCVGRGTLTQERNFLPFIPWLQRRAEVRTFMGQNEIESIGVNTKADLHLIEKYFRNEEKRSIDNYSRL